MPLKKNPLEAALGMIKTLYYNLFIGRAAEQLCNNLSQNINDIITRLIAEIKSKPTLSNLSKLRDTLLEAKNKGIDISNYELELPLIEKSVYTQFLDNMLEEISNDSSYDPVLSFERYRIILLNAKESGVDVENYEVRLPELEKFVRGKYLDSRYNIVLNDPSVYNLQQFKDALGDLRIRGIDISEYKGKLSELEGLVQENNPKINFLGEVPDSRIVQYCDLVMDFSPMELSEVSGIDTLNGGVVTNLSIIEGSKIKFDLLTPNNDCILIFHLITKKGIKRNITYFIPLIN